MMAEIVCLSSKYLHIPVTYVDRVVYINTHSFHSWLLHKTALNSRFERFLVFQGKFLKIEDGSLMQKRL